MMLSPAQHEWKKNPPAVKALWDIAEESSGPFSVNPVARNIPMDGCIILISYINMLYINAVY